MPKPFDRQSDRVYVLSKAFCRDGTVTGTRKQRLTCALVELRDRIQDEFKTVSRTWQVAAEDLRRCYSYAYPASTPGAPDPLILERACEEAMRCLRHEIQKNAEQFGVPDDLLEEILVDWLVSDAMEAPRTPTAYFIPPELVAPTTESGDANPKDVLPSTMHLLYGRPWGRTPAELRQPKELTDDHPVDGRPLLPQTVDRSGEA